MNGILNALEEFELEKGTIVTSEKEGEETIDGKKIRYIPLWRFLLED